jgi:hypothetical protein
MDNEDKSHMADEGYKTDKVLKYTLKDSVFSDLFKIRKNLFRLYKDFHPEDVGATEEELGDVTIKNVMTDKIYNDLGFIVGNRLIVFIEAQSSWTLNIIIRVLMYLAQTYYEYFQRTSQNLYRSTKVTMPKPEIYVVYTGERGDKPDTISLSKDFFGGERLAIDIEAKVIYESDDDSIINEYIKFTKVYDEQRRRYGRTREAITETIRICKDRNLLKEYLESREREVVTIMMSLFDEEEILKSYIACERKEAADEAAKKVTSEVTKKVTNEVTKKVAKESKIETAKNLILIMQDKMSIGEISAATGLTEETVRSLKEEVMQLA